MRNKLNFSNVTQCCDNADYCSSKPIKNNTTRHSAHDLIGYGRKYNNHARTAEDWLHEIREGDI